MGDVLEFGAVVAVILSATFVWRLGSIWIKRLSRHAEVGGDLDALRRRLEELEEHADHRQRDTEERLLEVEERLDFTERLLGQQRDRSALPPKD